jgi:hypothetical protein
MVRASQCVYKAAAVAFATSIQSARVYAVLSLNMSYQIGGELQVIDAFDSVCRTLPRAVETLRICKNCQELHKPHG